jgi:hypothetical protein
MLRWTLLLGCVTTLLSIGCGDDGGDDGSGGGEDASSNGPSGSGPSSGAGPSSGQTSGGGPIDTCAEVCALASSSTPQQDSCVAAYVEELGYPTDDTPTCEALLLNKTENQCNLCYGDIDITDAHCTAAYDTCF